MQGNDDKQPSFSDRFNSEERPKYVLDWDDSVQHNGETLYRIIYRDGSKGGWIQGYHNLSQYGDCEVCGKTVFTEPEDSQNSDSPSDEQEAMPADSADAIRQKFIPSSNFPNWNCRPDSVAYRPYPRCLVEILHDKDEDTYFFLIVIRYSSGWVGYSSPNYKMDDAFWELVGKVLVILNENRYEIPPYVLNGCPLLDEFYIDNDHIVDHLTLTSELSELGIQRH